MYPNTFRSNMYWRKFGKTDIKYNSLQVFLPLQNFLQINVLCKYKNFLQKQCVNKGWKVILLL